MKKGENFTKDLARIVGNESVSDKIFDRISYAQHSMRLDLRTENIPLVVVKPVSARQVSDVVRYANKKAVPIYVQGALTSFKGAARPKRPGSIILNES